MKGPLRPIILSAIFPSLIPTPVLLPFRVSLYFALPCQDTGYSLGRLIALASSICYTPSPIHICVCRHLRTQKSQTNPLRPIGKRRHSLALSRVHAPFPIREYLYAIAIWSSFRERTASRDDVVFDISPNPIKARIVRVEPQYH